MEQSRGGRGKQFGGENREMEETKGQQNRGGDDDEKGREKSWPWRNKNHSCTCKPDLNDGLHHTSNETQPGGFKKYFSLRKNVKG